MTVATKWSMVSAPTTTTKTAMMRLMLTAFLLWRGWLWVSLSERSATVSGAWRLYARRPVIAHEMALGLVNVDHLGKGRSLKSG